jgi:nucleoside-diphosphate-sugar epimerase
MKVALTGATGFVGCATLAELNARGHDVRALLRNPSKAKDLRATSVAGDLASIAALDELVAGCEAVIHLAGSISAARRADFYAANETGARNIANAASRAGIKRFIHVSSLAAREPELSDYAASKSAGEAAVQEVMTSAKLLILRPPAIYGPTDRATLPLFRALTSSPAVLPGTAEQRFSLLYVGDLGRLLADALETGEAGVREVHDGRPDGYSWSDLAHIASAHERRTIEPYFLPRALLTGAAFAMEPLARLRGKPAMLSRAKVNELYHRDWVAKGPGLPLPDAIGFVEGFARTVSWYRASGWLPPRKRSLIKQPQDTRA